MVIDGGDAGNGGDAMDAISLFLNAGNGNADNFLCRRISLSQGRRRRWRCETDGRRRWCKQIQTVGNPPPPATPQSAAATPATPFRLQSGSLQAGRWGLSAVVAVACRWSLSAVVMACLVNQMLQTVYFLLFFVIIVVV